MTKKSEFASMDLLTAFQSGGDPEKLRMSEIHPNPLQPRIFGKDRVEDLVDSMSRLGLIEPIVVRKEDDKYQIVAGERRYRAAQKLGWTEIPARIVNDSIDVCYEMALAENEKRKSLNPWEVGRAVAFLRRERKKTAEEVAGILGYTERYIKQLSSIARLDQKSVEDLIKTGKEPSIKNLESLLREREGRGGEIISPIEKKVRDSKVTVDLKVLPLKKREAFVRELQLLKKRYGLA